MDICFPNFVISGSFFKVFFMSILKGFFLWKKTNYLDNYRNEKLGVENTGIC